MKFRFIIIIIILIFDRLKVKKNFKNKKFFY